MSVSSTWDILLCRCHNTVCNRRGAPEGNLASLREVMSSRTNASRLANITSESALHYGKLCHRETTKTGLRWLYQVELLYSSFWYCRGCVIVFSFIDAVGSGWHRRTQIYPRQAHRPWISDKKMACRARPRIPHQTWISVTTQAYLSATLGPNNLYFFDLCIH